MCGWSSCGINILSVILFWGALKVNSEIKSIPIINWRFVIRIQFKHLLNKVVTVFLHSFSSSVFTCIQPFAVAAVNRLRRRGSKNQVKKQVKSTQNGTLKSNALNSVP